MQAFVSRASALALALFASACVASSDAMTELGQPLPHLPRPGYAMVVFVRPSTYADVIRYTIFSERYGFLGHSLPASWFAAELPAGPHVFCAKGENTAALRAGLAPGRTYYVEVASRPGFFSSRVQLLAIAPRRQHWLERYDWLAESEGYRLTDASESEIDRDDMADLQGSCRERLSEYTPSELADRTLQPDDGS